MVLGVASASGFRVRGFGGSSRIRARGFEPWFEVSALIGTRVRGSSAN